MSSTDRNGKLTYWCEKTINGLCYQVKWVDEYTELKIADYDSEETAEKVCDEIRWFNFGMFYNTNCPQDFPMLKELKRQLNGYSGIVNSFDV